MLQRKCKWSPHIVFTEGRTESHFNVYQTGQKLRVCQLPCRAGVVKKSAGGLRPELVCRESFSEGMVLLELVPRASLTIVKNVSGECWWPEQVHRRWPMERQGNFPGSEYLASYVLIWQLHIYPNINNEKRSKVIRQVLQLWNATYCSTTCCSHLTIYWDIFHSRWV